MWPAQDHMFINVKSGSKIQAPGSQRSFYGQLCLNSEGLKRGYEYADECGCNSETWNQRNVRRKLKGLSMSLTGMAP